MKKKVYGFFFFRFSVYAVISIFIISCNRQTSNRQQEAVKDSLYAVTHAITGVLNQDSSNSSFYFERAKSYMARKEFPAAIQNMKIALKKDSSKAAYYILLSDLYFTQNQTKDTRDMLRKAMRLDNTNALAMMKYSQLFYLLRKYDTAIFYVNRSLHFDRANATAHFQRGMILKEAGDTTNSISSFQNAVELNPQYYDAYMQLGLLFAKKKKPLALDYFNTALKLNPKSVEALYGKGMYLQDRGDYKNSLITYNNLLAISPGNRDAAFNIGAIYFQQKKYADALKQFELITISDANFYRGYYGQGICNEMIGDKQKAIANLKHCLSINPDFKPAVSRMNILLQKQKWSDKIHDNNP